MQYSKYSFSCCSWKRPHKYLFFSWTIWHTAFNTFSMLPLWISNLSCGLGSLGRKMIHTCTLTLVSWNILDHIPRFHYYTQKYYSRMGEWQIQSGWAARGWSMLQQMMQSAPDQNESRKGTWSGFSILHPSWLYFWSLPLICFQGYSFTVLGTKLSQCCSLKNTKQLSAFI